MVKKKKHKKFAKIMIVILTILYIKLKIFFGIFLITTLALVWLLVLVQVPQLYASYKWYFTLGFYSGITLIILDVLRTVSKLIDYLLKKK